ncbi:MAG: PilZ domain-containing protein [Thermodesulfobacteriota bacterium]
MKDSIYYREKRRYPRVSMDLPVDYWVKQDTDAHGGIVIDASETGFLIHSVEDIPVGTKLKIAVLFPKEYELANFEVSAEIIRKKMVENGEVGYQYGIRFTKILEEDYGKLRELFIAKLLGD